MYSRIYVHILEIAYSPTLLPKGALTPSKWHISPNCWQNISNTNIQIQLTYIPPIVGRIYPIQIYLIQGPNLPPRGPICRGPICRGPICRRFAMFASLVNSWHHLHCHKGLPYFLHQLVSFSARVTSKKSLQVVRVSDIRGDPQSEPRV